ncbi:hypothetical protein GF357_01305 [Candidatus Dojkabacteria bacterium]|nr:hypothetical protein [Candidatus Dojkabacteria bacterium]
MIKYRILNPDNSEIQLNPNKINEKLIKSLEIDENLKNYLRSKFIKGRKGKELESSRLAQKLRICEPEEASDVGNLRWLPNGVVVFNAVKKWCKHIALDVLKAYEIDSPIMYDWSYPDIKAQGQSFHGRHYKINVAKGKKLILRFAGDFGLFRIMKQAQFSHWQLPIRVFEFSKSFRYEKHGEVSGLKRPRAFHMPDIHSFCKDLDEAWSEFIELFRSYEKLNKDMGLKLAIEFPVVSDFLENNLSKIQNLVKWLDRSVLLEVLPGMKHYWVIKGDFHYVDQGLNEGQISTVQLDIEDAQRYGINYIDEKGKKQGCVIVHSSLGSIERILYGLLEKSALDNALPFWLAPVQVAVLPVSQAYNAKAINLAKYLDKEGFRALVDDRDESVNRKVRDWHKEWIPANIVIGKKEVNSKNFALQMRGSDEVKKLAKSDLIELLNSAQENMPFVRANSRLLRSGRVGF